MNAKPKIEGESQHAHIVLGQDTEGTHGNRPSPTWSSPAGCIVLVRAIG